MHQRPTPLPDRVRVVRWATPFVFSLLGSGIVAGLQSASTETGLARLEREAYSWHLLHRAARKPRPDFALVVRDDPAYEQQEASVIPPWGMPGRPLESYRSSDCDCFVPRVCYATALRRLKRWNARGIVLDLFFKNRCRNSHGVSEDPDLAQALRENGRVVLAAPVDVQSLNRAGDPLASFNVRLPGIEELERSAYAVGSPLVNPRDNVNGVELEQVVRGATAEESVLLEALPISAWKLYRGDPAKKSDWLSGWKDRLVEGPDYRLLGSLFTGGGPHRVPSVEIEPRYGTVLPDEVFFPKRMLIDWSCGADRVGGRYVPTRLSTLLSMSDAVGRAEFEGKLVFIGDGGTDRQKTVAGLLPGMEIHANAVSTLLSGRPILPLGPGWVLSWMFVLSTVAALVIRNLRAAPAVASIVCLLLLMQGVSALLLQHANLWLMAATPSAAVLSTALISGAAEGGRIQHLVSRLLPARIRHVLDQNRGGFRVEEGTVLFSDIRGYSTFSEYLDPAAVMGLLNKYFSEVQLILDRYEGHFVKSPGDCLVAWFPPVRRGAHHAERALRAGLDIVQNAEEFGLRWAEQGAQPFRVGVGVNTGSMAVGILNARDHIEPTVIGDTVNLAARIEAMTHRRGDAILASEATVAPVREQFCCEYIGEMAVEGRKRSVRVYQVLSLAATAAATLPSGLAD